MTPSRRTLSLTVLVGLVVGVSVQSAGTALIVSKPLATPDAIVSLASHEWERLPLTTRLAAEYPNALVLLTLPRAVTIHNCHDCSRRVALLRAAGVDAGRIHVLPLAAGGTYGEAEACRDFASRVPLRHLLIVTSPYHTRRALAVFRAVLPSTGVQVGVMPATAFSPARPSWWWVHGYDRAYVGYEWAATVYYGIRYGVIPLLTNDGP